MNRKSYFGRLEWSPQWLCSRSRLNGVGYFLCSLGYFFLGIIIVTQLNRETHLPSGLKAFKVLAYYGFQRDLLFRRVVVSNLLSTGHPIHHLGRSTN